MKNFTISEELMVQLVNILGKLPSGQFVPETDNKPVAILFLEMIQIFNGQVVAEKNPNDPTGANQ